MPRISGSSAIQYGRALAWRLKVSGECRAHISRVYWIAGGPRHLGIGHALCVPRLCYFRAVVVVDSARMPCYRHHFWHWHADTRSSGSDILAGGRRAWRTSGRQRVAAGNRRHAGRIFDHSAFKPCAAGTRSACARLAACRADGTPGGRRHASFHSDRDAGSVALRLHAAPPASLSARSRCVIAALVPSALMAIAFPPCDLMSATTRAASALLKEVIHDNGGACRAQALGSAPISFDAPVMTATLPCKSPVRISLPGVHPPSPQRDHAHGMILISAKTTTECAPIPVPSRRSNAPTTKG